MTLMQSLLDEGYPRSEMYHHGSDLYVFKTPETEQVIKQWGKKTGYRWTWLMPEFIDRVTGRRMYDCAFQYIPPTVVALVGPSASGKSAIIKQACDWGAFTQLKSVTTREPRKGTQDTDYIFVSCDEFQHMIDADEFVEWTEYNGNLYGTPKSELERAVSCHMTSIAAFNWNGAKALKALLGPVRCLTVFVNREREEVCRAIKARKTSEDEKLSRISRLDQDYALKERCDVVLDNNSTIEEAAKKLLQMI